MKVDLTSNDMHIENEGVLMLAINSRILGYIRRLLM